MECSYTHDGFCETPRACFEPPGTQRYDVYESIDGGPFRPTGGTVCLTAAQAAAAGTVTLTPADVAAAFAKLIWRAPVAVIEPPGGRTLVNFKTNFYTKLTDPQTQTVTLLGQAVTIEARPTAYAWDYGDGTVDHTTDPGTAYPGLEITHKYEKADVTVTPRVIVTYTGRYRVNGGGWQGIPQTLDVAGPRQVLRIMSATPVLVG